MRVTTGELLGRAEAAVRPLADTRGVTLVSRSDLEVDVPSRRANLVLLVLDNFTSKCLRSHAAGPPGHVACRARSDRG